MISYWINSTEIKDYILIPKYYDPNIDSHLELINDKYDLYILEKLFEDNIIEVSTGDEIGKMAYGTGDIPFVRTSDISNWEIKSAPKQGVSEGIYNDYSIVQDIKEEDILLVRDGTYLIGTNCFISELDIKILFQSHILKFRIKDKSILDPILFFTALNSEIVQQQIRSFQFTADIIDTIGNRYREIIIPIPKMSIDKEKISKLISNALSERVKGKAFIKQYPLLIEEVLEKNSLDPLDDFFKMSLKEIKDVLRHDTIRSEEGTFRTFWQDSTEINNLIYLPKYYDPSLVQELEALSKHCDLISMGELKESNSINYYTGDEIGKMAYGTGEIPYIRTSDFANWEIKHNPKQGISQEIYEIYNEKQNINANDIFLVRDGTYLVGTSCLVSKFDQKCLFCGGLYKITVLKNEILDPWLLLTFLI